MKSKPSITPLSIFLFLSVCSLNARTDACPSFPVHSTSMSSQSEVNPAVGILFNAALGTHSPDQSSSSEENATDLLDKIKTSELMLASKNGNLVKVQALLDDKADPNQLTPGCGFSALMFAAAHGSLLVVQALLAANANPNQFTSTGYSALTFAASSGRLLVVQALLAAGADPNPCKGAPSALMFASALGYLPVVQALLAVKANPNIYCCNYSALMLARNNKHFKIVQALKAAGANPEQLNKLRGRSGRR